MKAKPTRSHHTPPAPPPRSHHAPAVAVAAPDLAHVTIVKDGEPPKVIDVGTWNMDEKALRAEGYTLVEGPNP